MSLEDTIAEAVRSVVVAELAKAVVPARVYNLTAAAEYLQVGPQTVKALVEAGELTCLRSGNGYRFGIAQLDGLLARGAVIEGVAS